MPSSPAARPAGDPSRRFRAMSFNLWADRAESRSWKLRRPLVASLLRFHRPDLIGFQEAVHARTLEMAEALPGYAWIGAGRTDGVQRGEMTPVFYREELFRLVRSGTFWLSPTPEVPSKGWDAAYPRIATWAVLEHRACGIPFFFANTHLDHGGSQARRHGAALLLRKIEELAGGLPRLLAGDFNCRPSSVTYKIVTGALEGGKPALRDSFECSIERPLGPTLTWRGMFRGVMPPARLDYLFVGGAVEVGQHAVLADHWDGRPPSDHLPVAADLFLTGPGKAGA